MGELATWEGGAELTKEQGAGLACLVKDVRLLGKMSRVDIFAGIDAEVKDMRDIHVRLNVVVV